MNAHPLPPAKRAPERPKSQQDDSEEAQTRAATKVPVDLSLSAYANARAHHEARKKQLAKRDKTLAANEAALKAAEKKAAAQLANLRSAASTAQVRRAARRALCVSGVWRRLGRFVCRCALSVCCVSRCAP